jgi:hypothetical protein
MKGCPALLKVPVKIGHMAPDGVAISALDAVHKGYKRFFDLGFHILGSTQPNTEGAVVKRDCNLPGESPPCLNSGGRRADCGQNPL